MPKSYPIFLSRLVLALAFVASSGAMLAQFEPASPPIADPGDRRFIDVKEDWTSPSLATSSLKLAPPLVGYMDDRSKYTVELIQLQWRFGDPIDLYVMKPKRVEKPAVILYLYGYPADTDRFKNERFQEAATRNGFAAVGFVSALTGHRYHDRPMQEWFISELQEALGTSAHDVQMVLNYLSTRQDLDVNRVGMFAQGSGASIAILASAVDPRIKVLDVLDPWGDWPDWMANSPFVPEQERSEYVKPEFLNKAAELDPLRWLQKVQARKFRLQYAAFDANTPAIAKGKIRASLPEGATFTLYKTHEEFNTIVRAGQELEWIKQRL